MKQPLIQPLPVYPNAKCTPAAQVLQASDALHANPIHALYLHVPFCFHKCHYCDFYSIVEPVDRLPGRQQAFVSRLIAELELRASQFQPSPSTIFVGGGTPTLLPPDHWRQILTAMRRLGLLEQVREFTVEANPETLTRELADVLAAGGVNRMSIGAQSFNPVLLKTLERWHDPVTVPRAMNIIRAAGIDNVNLDLIFAIPGQTLPMVHDDLAEALALAPDHLSYYSLIYEPNTAMTQRLKMGQFEPMDEDTERQMYADVIERLAAAGFEQYEVSNWARKTPAVSRQCQHNMIYWKNGNWLGIGPAAASHVQGHRWKNLPHLGQYLASTDEPPTTDYEHLPLPRRVGELLMLLLRLREGAPLSWMQENLPPDDPRQQTINELIEIGMLERAEDHLRLTDRGLFVADAVIAKLL